MTKAVHQMPAMTSLYVQAIKKKNNRKHGANDPLPKLELTLDNLKIDKKHLRQYQGLCGFARDNLVPPTYLQIVSFPLQMALLTDEQMPFAVMGIVHLNNRIDVYEPIDQLDQPLTLKVFIGEQQLTANGVLFEVVAEVYTKGTREQPVWRATAGLLHRCKTDIEKAASVARLPMQQNKRPWNLPANIGRRYGLLSKDMNPIHLYATTAKLFGFKRQIAHGLFINAKASAQMEGQMPPAPYSINTEFKRPVFLPAKPVLHQQTTDAGIHMELWSKDNKNLHMAVQIQPLNSTEG